MRLSHGWVGLLAGAMLVGSATAQEAKLEVKTVGKTLEISRDGQPLTVYRFGNENGAAKPFFWPVQGPFGQPVTRAYPNVKNVAGETTDHLHHRGLHFTHGEVSLSTQASEHIDFWTETAKPDKQGKIAHVKFDAEPTVSDGSVRFAVSNQWLSPTGKAMLAERQQWQIHTLPGGATMFVLKVELTPAEGVASVSFLDTKEGSLSIRVASSMDENQGKNDKRPAEQRGEISNNAGLKGEKNCWGRPADWVDYSGPVAGKLVGVAVFDHPENRPRARWHVRAYGLFAANPFGSASFDKTAPKSVVTLETGKTLTLRYGVYVHAGNAEEAQVGGAFQQFLQWAN